MVAFGSAPIAPTPVLDLLRIELPLGGVLREPTVPTPLLTSYVTYFQRRTMWCWAAVAMSVARYYEPTSTVTQCQIASQVLGRDCCFGPSGPDACNVTVALDAALEAVGHDGRSGDPDPDLARHLIDDNRPVGVFIEWTPHAGHFAALIGYSRSAGGDEFVVADPRYGNRAVTVAELLDGRYRGVGTWTRLYRTRRDR